MGKEKRLQKTSGLFKSQIDAIQDFADKEYDGDFSQALRKIIALWDDKK